MPQDADEGKFSAAVGATACLDCAAGKYSGVRTWNPSEASRSYSSVFCNEAPGTGHARSMLDSEQAWSAGGWGWSPGSQWMRIDLGDALHVHGVVIQARDGANQYVTEVEVQHSLDQNSGFSSVQSQAIGGFRFFPTSTNSHKSELIFLEPVVAQFIKIVVWAWNSHISMRAGVLSSTGSTTGPDGPSTAALVFSKNPPPLPDHLSPRGVCACVRISRVRRAHAHIHLALSRSSAI